MAAFSVAIPHFIMLGASSPALAEIVSVLAVEVFFVLSGFVLGPQILRCLQTGRASDFGVFLMRRWMRTIPPYLFALALMSTIVGHVRFADVARYAFYVENLFAQCNIDDFFPVAWSLSIEEWFYIAFPGLLLIARWCVRKNTDRLAVLVALCLIGTITILRLLFGNLDDWGANVRRVVVFRLDSIAYGFLLYMFVRYVASGPLYSSRRILSLPVTSILFTVASAIAGILTWQIGVEQSNGAETLFPFAAAAFGMSAILLIYSVRDRFQHSVRLAQSCHFLGRISYSLYLFHLSVAMTIAPRLAGLPFGLQLLVFLGICIALSALFYRVFERPILATRPSYRRSTESAPIEVLSYAAQAKPTA